MHEEELALELYTHVLLPSTTATVLGNLKAFLVRSIKSQKGGGLFCGGMECAICGIGCLVKNGVSLPCRHVFCAACISAYFADHAHECPTCNTSAESFVVSRDGDEEVKQAAEQVPG